MSSTANQILIRYPEADRLDTKDRKQTSGYALDLYLIPAGETEDGIPRVTFHEGVGNIGTPERAWHGRWASIGRIGPQTVGSSVREALEEIEDALVAASEAYAGSYWDGSNRRGRWSDEPTDVLQAPYGSARESLRQAWQEVAGRKIRHYWDAVDWYGPAGDGWPELAHEAGVDPDAILDAEDWEETVARVAAAVEADQDELVRGTEEYLLGQADQYRSERAEDLEEDDR